LITFDIELTTRAKKDFNLLSDEALRKIVSELRRLSVSPFPDKKRIKKIRGLKSPIYRLRVETNKDSFRIFYAIVPPKQLLILRLVSKKNADRVINKLK